MLPRGDVEAGSNRPFPLGFSKGVLLRDPDGHAVLLAQP